MDQVTSSNFIMNTSEDCFEKGIKFLKRDQILEAYDALKICYESDPESPKYMSYFGLVLFLKTRHLGTPVSLCTNALKREPYNPDFYLNLGKIYIISDNPTGALNALRIGLQHNPDHAELLYYISTIRNRRRAVIPFLGRTNLINKYLGIFFRRILPRIWEKFLRKK